ncbi:MAG: Hsp20/alpha crystallin family protein [Bacteriovoracaceae bacterium]|nr:Hsp20/alpha crystallin family protein [Bacteriovoracaceae bacterium]
MLALKLTILTFLITNIAIADNPNSLKKNQRDPFDAQQKLLSEFFNEFMDDGFFNMDIDPFKEMETMRKRFRQHFKNHKDFDEFDSLFDNWHGGKFKPRHKNIDESENDEYVFYKMEIPGLSSIDVNVEVKNRVVTIKAKVVETHNKSKLNYKGISQFNQTFTLPDYVDPDSIDTSTKDDFLTLKFKKIPRKGKMKRPRQQLIPEQEIKI